MTKKLFFETEETTIRKVKGFVEVETDYIQLYKNFVKISHKITSVTTFKLLHWILAERLLDNNGINSGQIFKEFNQYLSDNCGQECTISEATFYRVMDELITVGAINRVDKGHYFANMHMFWGEKVDLRDQALRLFEKDENPKLRMLNPSETKKNLLEENKEFLTEQP